MQPRYTRLRLGLAALAVLAAAACTEGSDGDDKPAKASEEGSPSPAPSGWDVPQSLSIGAKIDQPGFNLFDSLQHEYAGFEAELAEFLGEKYGFEPMFADVPTKDRERKLTNKSVDLVIGTYSITDERKEQIDFVGPYLQTQQGLLVRADDTTIKERKDTADKQICTVQGSTSKPGKGNPLHKDAVISDDAKDYNACVQQLRDGNVDAVWTDQVILYGFAQRHDDVRVVDKIKVGKIQRYGIGMRKHNKPMCEALKQGLKTFVNDKWLPEFRERFGDIVKADRDFETSHMPAAADFDAYSQCTP